MFEGRTVGEAAWPTLAFGLEPWGWYKLVETLIGRVRLCLVIQIVRFRRPRWISC